MTYLARDNGFSEDLIALIPQLCAFARSLCRDATKAEDFVQDALAKAWASQSSFTPGTNLKAWTCMILRNLYCSERRRSWRSMPLDPAIAERTLIANTSDTGRLELDELRRALAMLSREHREALILIGVGGHSYPEADEICGVAFGTVKSRVTRARARLALIYAHGDILVDGAAPSAAMADLFHQSKACRLAHRG